VLCNSLVPRSLTYAYHVSFLAFLSAYPTAEERGGEITCQGRYQVVFLHVVHTRKQGKFPSFSWRPKFCQFTKIFYYLFEYAGNFAEIALQSFWMIELLRGLFVGFGS
jgi:hypothetical protein